MGGAVATHHGKGSKHMKTRHTHVGHCKICGRIHAVLNNTGELAKHGYKVTFGYFSGTCYGADAEPLEISRVVTDGTINDLRKYAERNVAIAAGLKDGSIDPVWYKLVKSETETGRYGRAKYDRVPCAKEELDAHKQYEQRDAARAGAAGAARDATAHARIKAEGTLMPLIG